MSTTESKFHVGQVVYMLVYKKCYARVTRAFLWKGGKGYGCVLQTPYGRDECHEKYLRALTPREYGTAARRKS